MVEEDVLLLIFSFLDIPDILILRNTCQKLRAISFLPIVWINASKFLIFPCTPGEDVEQSTRRSFRVASKWHAGRLPVHRETEFTSPMNTSITNIRFFRDRWVLTISNAIWSVLSVWDWKSGGHKCGEWSPQGAFFNGPMSLNTQQDANACIAILASRLDGPQHVVLLSLNNDGQLCEIRSIPTSLRPITLHGSLLALCDESSETNVYDFSQDTTIHLGFNSVSPRTNIVDHPIDVIFTSSHVLVVRARSIHLFEYPSSNFVASHTFGWVDSASVTHDPKTNEFSFLIRHQNDNPWTAQLTTLQMYTLSPSRDGTTYDFPPRPRLDIPSPRGTLRCPDVALGRYGTAVWICPRQQTLVVDDAAAGVLSTEILLATVFPGHLTPGGTMAIYTNNLNNWTALDYIEEKGRIVLGSSFGKVIVLEL